MRVRRNAVLILAPLFGFARCRRWLYPGTGPVCVSLVRPTPHENHDGKLVRSEIPKDVEALRQLGAHFREADLDGNGSLSKFECQRYVSNIVSGGL